MAYAGGYRGGYGDIPIHFLSPLSVSIVYPLTSMTVVAPTTTVALVEFGTSSVGVEDPGPRTVVLI